MEYFRIMTCLLDVQTIRHLFILIKNNIFSLTFILTKKIIFSIGDVGD